MYRIKSFTISDGKTFHHIQQKILFVYWATIIDGYTGDALSFNTLDEAKKAIDKYVQEDLIKTKSISYTNYP